MIPSLKLLEKLTFSLHAAIMKGKLEEVIAITKQFQEHDIAIDNAVMAGVPPIFRAIQSGNINIVKAVVEAGATTHATLKNEKTPLDFAQKGTEIYNFLQNYKAETPNTESSPSVQILLIPPDGNCMYNAIIEGYRRLGRDDTPDLESLREMVYSRIMRSSDSERNVYIDLLETQLIELITTFPRQIESIADLAGFNLEIYNIIAPYIHLYDSGEPVLDLIRQNRVVNKYIETILTDGNWGRNVELWVISRVLGIEIIIHGPGSPITINNTGNDASPSVHLRFAGNHYDLITYPPSNEPNIPETENATTIFDSNEDIIHVNDIYFHDDHMAIFCVAAIFIGCYSLYDNGYFQW